MQRVYAHFVEIAGGYLFELILIDDICQLLFDFNLRHVLLLLVFKNAALASLKVLN